MSVNSNFINIPLPWFDNLTPESVKQGLAVYDDVKEHLLQSSVTEGMVAMRRECRLCFQVFFSKMKSEIHANEHNALYADVFHPARKVQYSATGWKDASLGSTLTKAKDFLEVYFRDNSFSNEEKRSVCEGWLQFSLSDEEIDSIQQYIWNIGSNFPEGFRFEDHETKSDRNACSNTFKSDFKLKLHVLRQHPKQGMVADLFSCSQKDFYNFAKDVTQQHVKRHAGGAEVVKVKVKREASGWVCVESEIPYWNRDQFREVLERAHLESENRGKTPETSSPTRRNFSLGLDCEKFDTFINSKFDDFRRHVMRFHPFEGMVGPVWHCTFGGCRTPIQYSLKVMGQHLKSHANCNLEAKNCKTTAIWMGLEWQIVQDASTVEETSREKIWELYFTSHKVSEERKKELVEKFRDKNKPVDVLRTLPESTQMQFKRQRVREIQVQESAELPFESPADSELLVPELICFEMLEDRYAQATNRLLPYDMGHPK